VSACGGVIDTVVDYYLYMSLKPIVISPIDEDIEIDWKQLDYTGAFTGDYHGSLRQL
jgi:hypothetical protein